MFKSAFVLGLASSLAAAQQSNLTSILQSQSDLSTLTTLIGRFPNLASTLQNANSPWTLLAPTNEAFSALMNGTSAEAMAVKMNNTAAISALLQYHVLNGSFPLNALPNTTATYVESYYMPTTLATGQHVGARRSGENAIFTSGQLQASNSTQTNISAGRNGYYIHKISSVLTLPKNATNTLEDSSLYNSNFSSFVGAATTANLANRVNSANNITLFVPNNAAFSSIASLMSTLQSNSTLLPTILSYHVVPGAVLFSEDITNTSVRSLQGNDLTFRVEEGAVLVNNAKVVEPNIIIANGVAHVIDEVLNPMNTATDRQPTAAPTPAFSGAMSNSDGSNGFNSAAPTPTTMVTPNPAANGPASTSSGGAMPAMTQPAVFGAAGMAAAAYFLAI